MSPPKEPLPRFVQLTRRHKVYLSYLGQEEELKKLEELEKAREQATQQEKENSNDQPHTHTHVPSIPCGKPVDQHVNSIGQHIISSSEYGNLLDQGTSTVSSVPSCTAETGLLEDTPEPIPLTDSSLDVNKPIAFDIPLSATPADKSRKKISTKKLKMNQLTLIDIDKRNRKSSRTPGRPSMNNSNKRNFSERESPSHTDSKSKASKTIIEEHSSSRFSEYESLSVASERPA